MRHADQGLAGLPAVDGRGTQWGTRFAPSPAKGLFDWPESGCPLSRVISLKKTQMNSSKKSKEHSPARMIQLPSRGLSLVFSLAVSSWNLLTIRFSGQCKRGSLATTI